MDFIPKEEEEDETPLTFAEQKVKFEQISKEIEKNGGLSIKFSSSCQYSDPSEVDAADRRKIVAFVSSDDSEESIMLSTMAAQWTHFWHRSSIDPRPVLVVSSSSTPKCESAAAVARATSIVATQQLAMITAEKEDTNTRRIEARERLGLPACSPEDLPKTLQDFDINESLGYNVPLTLAQRELADEVPIHFSLIFPSDSEEGKTTQSYTFSGVNVIVKMSNSLPELKVRIIRLILHFLTLVLSSISRICCTFYPIFT